MLNYHEALHLLGGDMKLSQVWNIGPPALISNISVMTMSSSKAQIWPGHVCASGPLMALSKGSHRSSLLPLCSALSSHPALLGHTVVFVTCVCAICPACLATWLVPLHPWCLSSSAISIRPLLSGWGVDLPCSPGNTIASVYLAMTCFLGFSLQTTRSVSSSFCLPSTLHGLWCTVHAQ